MFAPVFGPFFWGKVLSSAGVWIHNIVAAIVAFELTGSVLIVGLVTAILFMPQLLLAPLSGKMADRGNAARQIILGRILSGLGSAGLAVWIWVAGGVDGLPGAGPVLGASLVVGLGFVLGGPALHSIVPSLIRPGEMAAAMALNSVPMTITRAAGPALGAGIATQFGAATAFGIAAGTNIVYSLIVLALRLPRTNSAGQGTDFSVLASVRYLRSDRPLLLLLFAIAAVGMGTDPSITLAPALAANLGAGATLVGWLASGFGIGAAVGFFVFSPLHALLGIRRLTSGGLLLMAVGLVIAGFSTEAALTLGSFGLSGVGFTLAFTSVTTQIQERTPDTLRGRIMGLWLVGFLGSRPLAAGMNGFLADIASVTAALLVSAAVVLVAAFFCRPNKLNAVVATSGSGTNTTD